MDYRICSIPGCGKRSLARGWCSKHYQRWETHGDPDYEPAPGRQRNGSTPTRFVAIGQPFGRWIVTGPEVRVAGNRRAAPVKCSCPRGTEKVVTFGDLFSGKSLSCGCLRGEQVGQKNREANPAITHGMTKHPLFWTWKGILSRCDDPSARDWPRYGGRGIKLCQDWHDVRIFIAWIEANLGPRPDGRYPSGMPLYSLDRIDNDGNYEPGNVQWATMATQGRNRRQSVWKRCPCGTRSPARSKFCCGCGSALPEV